MDSVEAKHVPEDMHHTFVVRERRWYLSMVFIVAINFCLFISMWYITFKAEDYDSRHSEYLGLAWGIFFIVLVAISIALFTPSPKRYRQRRTEFYDAPGSITAKNIINVSAGALTFILVVLYLFVYAIPTYNKPKWEISVEFATSELPIPAVAYVIPYNTSQPGVDPLAIAQPVNNFSISASVWGTYDTYYVPANGTYAENATEFESQYTLLVANASVIMNQFDNPLGDSLIVSMNGTWNSSATDIADDVPSVYLFAFDSRVDPRLFVLCGLVPEVNINAFATNNFEITATRISDKEGMTHPPETYDESCREFYEDLLQNMNPPLVQYQLSQTASSSNDNNNLTSCDASINRNASCQTSSVLQYGNQIVTEYESVPGKDTVSIWVDVGAIMGAVQGLAWFAMQVVKG